MQIPFQSWTNTNSVPTCTGQVAPSLFGQFYPLTRRWMFLSLLMQYLFLPLQLYSEGFSFPVPLWFGFYITLAHFILLTANQWTAQFCPSAFLFVFFFFFAYFLFISAPDIFCWASWAGLRSSACRSFQLPFFFRQSHLSSNKEVFQIALRQSDQSLCTNKPWLYIRLGHSVIPGVSVSQHKIIKYAKTPPYIKTTGHRTCREYFFHSQDQRCKTKDKTVTSVTIFPGGGFKSCRC